MISVVNVVDIVFCMNGYVEVEDVVYVRNVEFVGCDVGGN